MTNLISVFLLCKNGINWCSDNYKLRNIRDYYTEVAIGRLMSNLFILYTSDLYKFALLSQTLKVMKSDMEILHYRLGN